MAIVPLFLGHHAGSWCGWLWRVCRGTSARGQHGTNTALLWFQWHGLAEEANAPESTFASLIKCIEGQYHRENSYHSSVHGADVLQTVHVLLTTGHAGQRLQPIQRLSLLLASAAHDVGT